jgi:hypothetical protein
MTCREKLAIEHPDKIDPDCDGGCKRCPSEYGYLPEGFGCSGPNDEACTKCWDREIPGTEPAKTSNQVNLHKLIDDAMEKKNREVSIFIMKDSTSVYVRPISASDPRWIVHEENRTRHVMRYLFECSECSTYSENPTPYCPHCGEKLRMPVIEDKRVEDSVKYSVKEAKDDA